MNIHLAKILGEVDDGDVPLESNVHEVLPDEENIQEELDVETYKAFPTFFKGLKMNKATRGSLSREAQQAWDNIPQKDKNIILRSCAGMSPSNTRSTPRSTIW